MAETLVSILNKCTPNALADYLAQLDLGSLLRGVVTHLYRQVPATTSDYNLSSVHVIKLPDDAKAAQVHRASARAGTVTGEFAPQAAYATPTTGQVAVTPSGDIAFVGTDAVTDVDVVYSPLKGDVIELTLPVTSNAMSIPAAFTTSPTGVTTLIEAEVTAGTSKGKKVILAPTGSAVNAGYARLSLLKDSVIFNATDAATQARVKLLVVPAVDVNALLEAAPTF